MKAADEERWRAENLAILTELRAEREKAEKEQSDLRETERKEKEAAEKRRREKLKEDLEQMRRDRAKRKESEAKRAAVAMVSFHFLYSIFRWIMLCVGFHLL